MFWTLAETWRVIFYTQIRQQAIYRLNFLTPYFLKLFQLIGSLAVWKVIFESQNEIKGYSFPEMATYLIFAQFAALLFAPIHMFELKELVRKGTLSIFLVRPIQYLLISFAQFAGKKFFHLILYFLIGTFLFHLSFEVFFLALLSLSLSFSFGFFVSTLTFYLIEMWPIKRLFQAGMMILGGTLVPLDLLPPSISNLAIYSPFAFFSYLNVKAFQGTISILPHLVVALALNAIFLLGSILMYQRGVRRYEAVGC